jgi:hypothetical protein
MDEGERDSEVKEVATLADLDALDEDSIVRGYRDSGARTPNFTRKDQAYWHGYLNGEADAGRCCISEPQRELARAYIARQRAH